MTKAINEVFKFVNDQPGYRASLGVISSSKAEKTILAWGAVNLETDEIWVPELEDIKHSWTDAKWTPMNQQQASLFDDAYQREHTPRQEWLLSL
jgi:hypothetical protein